MKTPAGIALIAGFALAEIWKAVSARRVSLSPQLALTAAVFVATFFTFFVVSFESIFRVELVPLFHLRQLQASETIGGFVLDLLWISLPALIVLTSGIPDPARRSAPLLWLALGPLLIANMTRITNTGEGGGGAGDEWLQRLLQQAAWSDAIPAAARMHGWTYLVIRKDYVHPQPVPLERMFDGPLYSVYRFR